VLLFRIWALKEKTEVRGQLSEVGRATEAGLSLDGSPFSEKNGCKFQDASCKKKKEDSFPMAMSSLLTSKK